MPHFTITAALLRRVESIAALRERIQSATVQVPRIPGLQKDTRARNTHSSTAIEGNPLTLEEVRALEEGATVAAPARARREVLNYFAALRHVEKQAGKKRLTHEDIFRLHAIIAGEVMDQGEAGGDATRTQHFTRRVNLHGRNLQWHGPSQQELAPPGKLPNCRFEVETSRNLWSGLACHTN